MKCLIPIVLTLLIINSCTISVDEPNSKNRIPSPTTTIINNSHFTIQTIDSCEYIEYDYGLADQRVYSLVHKGNCKFCVLRQQKKK